MTSAAPPSISTSQLYPDYCHVLSPTIGKWCPMRAVDVLALRDVGMFCDGIQLFHHKNHPVKWVRLTGVIVAVDEFLGNEDRVTKGTGPGRMIYTLDDSSGVCIECTAITPAKPPPNSKASSRVPNHIDQLEALQAKLEERRKGKKEIALRLAGYTKMEQKKEDKKEEDKLTPSVMNPAIPWDNVDVGSVVKVKGRVGSFRDQRKVEIVKIEVIRSTDMEVRCWNEAREFRERILATPWVVSKEDEENCKRRRQRDLKRIRKGEKGKEKDGRVDQLRQAVREKSGKAEGGLLKAQRRERIEDRKKDYDARGKALRERLHSRNTPMATTKLAAG